MCRGAEGTAPVTTACLRRSLRVKPPTSWLESQVMMKNNVQNIYYMEPSSYFYGNFHQLPPWNHRYFQRN